MSGMSHCQVGDQVCFTILANRPQAKDSGYAGQLRLGPLSSEVVDAIFGMSHKGAAVPNNCHSMASYKVPSMKTRVLVLLVTPLCL